MALNNCNDSFEELHRTNPLIIQVQETTSLSTSMSSLKSRFASDKLSHLTYISNKALLTTKLFPNPCLTIIPWIPFPVCKYPCCPQATSTLTKAAIFGFTSIFRNRLIASSNNPVLTYPAIKPLHETESLTSIPSNTLLASLHTPETL
ncbi:hypothetical protein LguiA_024000 [Lonicera macranthoides]